MAKKRGRTRGGLQSPGKRQLRKTYVSGNAERRRRHHLLIPWKRDAKREPHRAACGKPPGDTDFVRLTTPRSAGTFGVRQKTADSMAGNCRMRRTLVFLLFLIEWYHYRTGRGICQGERGKFRAENVALSQKRTPRRGNPFFFCCNLCCNTAGVRGFPKKPRRIPRQYYLYSSAIFFRRA